MFTESDSNSNPYSTSLKVGCLFLSITFTCSNAFASDESEYRSNIFREILNGLNDKDKELANQLVEIRIEQERKHGKAMSISPSKNNEVGSTIKTPLEPITAQSSNPLPSKEFDKDYPIDGTKDFYTATGNRFIVGYSFGKTENLGLRTEVSGSTKSDANKIVDASTYNFYQKNTSISAFVDWYPTNSNFRLTGGVSVNDMRTRLTGVNNRTLNINGSQVALGTKTFNVDMKFPVIAPYVGFGFINRKVDSLGFGYFGDLGLTFGKYNAMATTNLISLKTISASDADAELNNLRKSLYRYSFVPSATVGLTYRYN